MNYDWRTDELESQMEEVWQRDRKLVADLVRGNGAFQRLPSRGLGEK
jgi:hypothetical protein